jgi:SPX domain protein involved in polyphosphate accumulation
VTEPTPENPRPPRREWTEDDEKAFVAQLEFELDKVFTFQKVRSTELVRKIRDKEKEVNSLVTRLEASRQQGASVSEEEQKNIENEFEVLEEDLSSIIADVHDLAKFTQLNYTGFQKIIKKHDVSTANVD